MFVEGFGGGLPVEGFAGPAVECCGDGVQVASGVSAEVGTFGEVLAEETVGVLVSSTEPRPVQPLAMVTESKLGVANWPEGHG